MGKRFTDDNIPYVAGEDLYIGKYFSPLGYHVRRDVTTQVVPDRLHASPHSIYRRLTIDRIAVRVSAVNGGGSGRLGIYDSKDCTPNNLILDAGEVDCSATGVKAAVVEQQLAPGLYFFVATFSHDPSIYYLNHAYDQAGYILGSRTDDLYHPYGGFFGSLAYGALPNPFPSPLLTQNVLLNIAFRTKSMD